MKKTKVIASIGPSSFDYAIMKKMVQAGLNIVRINLSHAKLDDMEKIYSNVVRLREELGVSLPIMLDTRGPELRVGIFKDEKVEIKKNQKFIFTSRNVVGDNQQVSINLKKIVSSVKRGDKILACDGLLTFKVDDVQNGDILTKAMNSGIISNRKSLFIPGVQLDVPYLNAADKKDILWGIDKDVDFVAASFVNSPDDVLCLKKFITKNGGNMKIIAKIESKLGVQNVEKIINVADGIMVARGDLGVELPIEKLPAIQKDLISLACEKAKPVIVATEMLESMISSNRPTRAEVNDVACAVYDGTSCVMLSGETASGKFPIESVKTMSNVAVETERHIKTDINSIADFVSFGAMSENVVQNIKAIVSFTDSDVTTGLVSRKHPRINVFGATSNRKVFRSLELLWGVQPVLTPKYKKTEDIFKIATEIVKKNKVCKTGDKFIVTYGASAVNGGTNLIKIIEVG